MKNNSIYKKKYKYYILYNIYIALLQSKILLMTNNHLTKLWFLHRTDHALSHLLIGVVAVLRTPSKTISFLDENREFTFKNSKTLKTVIISWIKNTIRLHKISKI